MDRLLKHLTLLFALLVSGLSGLACRNSSEPAWAAAEELVLERQVAGLRTLLNADPEGPLLPMGDVLVVVREQFVQSLIDAALPIEDVVAERYHVRLERANVTVADGVALVKLEGSAGLTGLLSDSGFASLVVHADLNIFDIDPFSQTLRARVQLITFETRELKVLGQDAPGRALVADLGRELLNGLTPLLSKIDIPIRIEHDLVLPRVGPGTVEISARTLPLLTTVSRVVAFQNLLFISLGVSVDPLTESGS